MQNTEMILTILVAVIAGAALIGLIILVAIFLAARKGMKMAGEYAVDLREKVMPAIEHSKELLQTTRQLITKLEPKLESAATDVAELARTASVESKKLSQSVDEIAERLRRQAARVDGMTTDALDRVDRAGHILDQVVTVPVRQVSGVMAAARAIIETLRAPAPPRNGQQPRR